MEIIPVVLGVAAVLVGGAALLGLLGGSKVTLYRNHGRTAPAGQHRAMQRVGGALLVAVGVFALVQGLAG